ncbi:MAG: DUF4147 domain-containing protein [Gammaproteobacteria bacterium]|nr:DUF4147 domain-containing protein [Gammaproteobacteria bacterium]
MGSSLAALSAGVSDSLRHQLAAWHTAGVQAVQGEAILPRYGTVAASAWHFRRGDRQLVLPLPDRARGGRLRLIGLGKAALGMARGLRASLRTGGIDIDDGFLLVRDVPREMSDEPWHVHLGDHPVPGPASLRAAQALLEFIDGPRAEDVYVVLLSGGASALCALPTPGVTLEEKIRITRELMQGGAPIAELNRVRRQLSAIKGGKLAERLAPAKFCTLAISDVPNDDPAVIGSAPTWSDDKPAPYAVIATLDDALTTIATVAARTCEVVALGRCVYGSVTVEVERLLERIEQALAAPRSPSQTRLLLAGGEPLVEIHGGGRGGRAQEFALRLGLALAERARTDRRYAAVCGLVAGTDGSDGPTEAAGAFFDAALAERLRAAQVDAAAALAASDSNAALRASGDLYVTGPTGTNVADVLMVVVTSR